MTTIVNREHRTYRVTQNGRVCDVGSCWNKWPCDVHGARVVGAPVADRNACRCGYQSCACLLAQASDTTPDDRTRYYTWSPENGLRRAAKPADSTPPDLAALFATARECAVAGGWALSSEALSDAVVNQQRYAARDLEALAAYMEHLHGPGTLHVATGPGLAPGFNAYLRKRGTATALGQGAAYNGVEDVPVVRERIGTFAAILPGELAWVVR